MAIENLLINSVLAGFAVSPVIWLVLRKRSKARLDRMNSRVEDLKEIGGRGGVELIGTPRTVPIDTVQEDPWDQGTQNPVRASIGQLGFYGGTTDPHCFAEGMPVPRP